MNTSKIEVQMDPVRVKQGKLLAHAIQKANTPSSCCHNQKYWTHVAFELASKPNTVTEFIPIREWIQSIQNGNLNIALKLCGNIEKYSEIQTRANCLIRELIKTYTYSNNIQAYIEEAAHLLRTLDALNLIYFYHKQGRPAAVKNYLYHEIKKNIELNAQSQKEVVDLVHSITFMFSENNMEDIFNSLKKIIPIRQNYVRFKNRLPSAYDGEVLILKFPIDAILDKQGEIVVWKTLGLDEGSFARFLRFKKTLYRNDSSQKDKTPHKMLPLESKSNDIEKIAKKYSDDTLKSSIKNDNYETEQISQVEHTNFKIDEDDIKVSGETLQG